MAKLIGKTALILSTETTLSRSVMDEIEKAGADVAILDVPESSEVAWDRELLSPGRTQAGMDVIINMCIPDTGGAIGAVTLADFRNILKISYVRTWLALKYGIQALRASGGGSFINITSVAGRHGSAGAAARCAASHGIELMTRSAALECAGKQDNVRVNALLVGDVISGYHDTYAPGHVSPKDVASAVKHLASDAAAYITGLIMPVDNGGGLSS